MIHKTLGDRLKYCLEKRGITQKDFADRMNVMEMTVSKWINGKSQPRADYIVVMCRKLGVSADWLLGMTGRFESAMEKAKENDNASDG